MSLDIYLYFRHSKTVKCPKCNEFITVFDEQRSGVFEANITHNLGKMASEAGVYDCLWRAPENGFTKAKQLIEPLSIGIELLEREPQRFLPLNPSNGWGSYADFVPWLRNLLSACIKNPEADIETSR